MARSARPRFTAEELEAREVPATAFALGTGINVNSLFRFDTATPATLSTPIPVTGLDATFNLVGIDFRPATGELYGFAVSGANTRLYTIDLAGAATPVGPAVIVDGIAGANKFGVDFNPVADRLRVVTDLTSDGPAPLSNVNNFRINPNTGALVEVDDDLDFAGVPGEAPEVTVAYTNNDTSTATGTTLFGITTGGNSLVTNGGAAPDFAVLAGVGPLNVVTVSNNAGLDIFSPANTAVAILDTAAGSQLFTVNLANGAATLVGLVGDGTVEFADVAVVPAIPPSLASGQTNGTVTPLVPTFFGTDAGQLTVGTPVTPIAGLSSNVRTTTGDVNGDGVDDIIAVTGPGTPIRVTVISGVDNTTVLVAPFDPFGGTTPFTGGGYVAAANFDPATGANADGKAEFVVSPDQGGGPRVVVFTFTAIGTAPTQRASFLGIDDANFRGGARPAVGDINGDGTLDLIVGAGFLGGPRTAIFNGTTVLGTPTRVIGDFIAFPGTDANTLRNGVFVSASDINGDGFDDLIFGGGPGGAPRVFILSGQQVAANQVEAAQAAPIANFFVAGNSTDRGGVRVSGANLDGDGRGDLIVGSGEGSAAKVRAYRGINFTSSGEPTTFQDLTLFGGAVLTNGVFVG